MSGDLVFELHPKQSIALSTDATEVGYGGAAGGGKSHLGRVSASYYSYLIPGLQTYLFRRTNNELVKNHMMGPTGFPALLTEWEQGGFIEIIKNEIRFANGPGKDPFKLGSKIFLCHCQHEKDVFSWLGPEMHYLIIEQAEQFTPFMIKMLRGRNRIPEALNIPAEYKHLFPRTLYTFNPGGVGHAWFKQNFVKALKRGADGVSEIVQQPDDEGGKRRQFIQAKLDDNPSVNPNEYRKTLRGLPPRMAKALEEGDFEQVIGAFYPEIQRNIHLIKAPFVIPSWWTRGMAMDWGACGEGDPFSIGWYAIADNTIPPYKHGDMIWYRRYTGHGMSKTTASAVADEIIKREAKDPQILDRVAGGDINQERGNVGPSIFETFSNKGIHFRRADDRRLMGEVEFRERLAKDDSTSTYWFPECEDDIETISSLQHDLHNPNEIAKGDDHDYDRVRYAFMSRPIVHHKPAEAKTIEEKFIQPTMNQLWQMKEQDERR